MSVSVDMPILGLALDQHPGGAPKGAMSQADNVVGDLPGIVRGRPNNTVIYSENPLDPDDYGRPDTLIRIGENWVAHQGGATPLWRNAAGAIAGFTEGSPYFGAPAQYAMARGSTYIGTSEGVAKLESGTSQTMFDAGVEMTIASQPFSLPKTALINAPPGPFTSPFSVGYRLVLKRTDANGYSARSAPSGIFVPVDPGTATDASVKLFGDAGDETWAFHAGAVREGDVVEFYRSRINTASADGPIAPDYYLVTTYEISAANITDGFFPAIGSGIGVYDTLDDDQLGEALYTNPARGGALAAKFPPPIASALALWSGAMWYGNVTERARAIYQLASVGGGTPPNRASDGQSFGVTTITGAIVLGTPDVTVASVDGIRPGMYIFGSPSQGPEFATEFPALTQVLSISGAGPYVVTVDKNAIGATGAYTFYFGDYIDFDGVRFYAALSTPGTNKAFGVSNSTDPAVRAAATAYAMSLVVTEWMVANGGDVRIVGTAPLQAAAIGGNAGRFVVEALDPDGTFSVGGTSAPDAFAPSIYKPTSPEDTAAQGRLYWSDPDEPEAVRLLSSVVVGNLRDRILALTPLRDALLVWKEDGLFRVTGVGPDRWSVDLLDPTLVLTRPGAVDVMRGTAYAVTNRGFVAVGENGISGLPAQGKVETLFRDPTTPLVVTWERLGLVLVADEVVSKENPTGLCDTVYCFAVATGVWSRWPAMYLSAFGGAASTFSPFAASTRENGSPTFEIREFSEEEGRGYDNVWGPIPFTVAGGSLVVADADREGWYPTAGDWIRYTGFFGAYRRVLSVLIDGTDWIVGLDFPPSTGEGAPTSLYAYEGAPVQLEWLPATAGNAPPFSLPLWREVIVSFSNGPATSTPPGDARLTVGIRHDQNQTIAEILGRVIRSISAMRPYRIGWPRQGSRRSVVWLRLGFSEILWPWRLTGVAYVGEGGSERVRR